MYYDTGSKDTDSGSDLFLFIVTTIVQHLDQLRFHSEFQNAISSGGERASGIRTASTGSRARARVTASAVAIAADILYGP